MSLTFKQKGKVVLLGDFNARVGKSSEVDDVIGTCMFGEETCNAFLNEVELVVCNGRKLVIEPEWTRVRPSLKQKSIIYYIVLGTQQTLAANLLFKNNSLCQTFWSLICDLLQWQVHKQRQCSGSLYTREAESKATKTFLSNQGNKEDSYMNNNEGIIHGQ